MLFCHILTGLTIGPTNIIYGHVFMGIFSVLECVSRWHAFFKVIGWTTGGGGGGGAGGVVSALGLVVYLVVTHSQHR